MKKEVFERFQGKQVKLTLGPDDFGIPGVIGNVFDDCFEFSSKTKTSIIAFSHVNKIVPL